MASISACEDRAPFNVTIPLEVSTFTVLGCTADICESRVWTLVVMAESSLYPYLSLFVGLDEQPTMVASSNMQASAEENLLNFFMKMLRKDLYPNLSIPTLGYPERAIHATAIRRVESEDELGTRFRLCASVLGFMCMSIGIKMD